MKKVKKNYIEKAVLAYNTFLHKGFGKEHAGDAMTYCKRAVDMDTLLWGTVWDTVLLCCMNKKGADDACAVLEILGFEVV